MTLTPEYHLYTIVPHAVEPRLLLLRREGGWSLPHIISEEAHPGIIGHINQAVKAQLGADVTALRCVYNALDPEDLTRERVYALENHSPTWKPPPHTHWVTRDELDSLTLSIPEHRPLLEAWFAEVEADVPAQRAAWARIGWFEMAGAWIHQQLDRLALAASGPVEQLRAWPISCILRIQTTDGYLYFKAVSDAFAYAPRLIERLASVYPENVPSVLAVDEGLGWILMRDFGNQTLAQVTDHARWAEAVRRFAQIQADCTRRADLLEIGCPDQRLDWLQSQIDSLLSDTGAMLPGQPKGLSAKEVGQLQVLGPHLKVACERLGAYGVPDTLVDNDFHSGDVILTDTGLIFFDWADSAVTCPFFSLVSLLDAENFVPSTPEQWARIRDAYLEVWADYVPMRKLTEAFDLALPVGALYHALNHRRVIERIEARDRWQLEGTVPYWLKKVLHHQSKLPRPHR